jgi:hypothetical protein
MIHLFTFYVKHSRIYVCCLPAPQSLYKRIDFLVKNFAVILLVQCLMFTCPKTIAWKSYYKDKPFFDIHSRIPIMCISV